MKVSIIVPVYNAAPYLRECIDSLVGQTWKDIEVILVNDGSTDESGAICESYLADPRVIYHHQQNAGVSTARNAGLDLATGEYICFVDSDDWLELDALERLKDETADIVIYNFSHEGRKHYEPLTDGIYATETLFPKMLSYVNENGNVSYIAHVIWMRLFKRELIEKNHIRFNPRYRNGEDLLFTINATMHSQTTSVRCSEYLYHYRQVGGSLSGAYVSDFWILRKAIIQEIYGLIRSDLLREQMPLRVFSWAVAGIENELRHTECSKTNIQQIVTDPVCDIFKGKLDTSAFSEKNKKYYTWICQKDVVGILADHNRHIKMNKHQKTVSRLNRAVNRIFERIRRALDRISIFAKVFPEYLRKGRTVYDDLELGNNVRLFYWRMAGDSENLGDYLSKVVSNHFREKLCPGGSAAQGHPRTLYAIGSILGFRCQDAVVWGSGLLNTGKLYLQRLALSKLDIRCVRGPKTREQLLKIGKNCPEVYGDPAILMPDIYQSQKTDKRYDTSLILHYTDKAEFSSLHRIDILTSDYEGFIDQIVQSSRVISSSLHGVILAEAYGVPAVLLLQEGKDIFKYLDWYHSTGRTEVTFARSLDEALAMDPMPLPDLRKMQEQVRNAFPVDLWSVK